MGFNREDRFFKVLKEDMVERDFRYSEGLNVSDNFEYSFTPKNNTGLSFHKLTHNFELLDMRGEYLYEVVIPEDAAVRYMNKSQFGAADRLILKKVGHLGSINVLETLCDIPEVWGDKERMVTNLSVLYANSYLYYPRYDQWLDYKHTMTNFAYKHNITYSDIIDRTCSHMANNHNKYSSAIKVAVERSLSLNDDINDVALCNILCHVSFTNTNHELGNNGFIINTCDRVADCNLRAFAPVMEKALRAGNLNVVKYLVEKRGFSDVLEEDVLQMILFGCGKGTFSNDTGFEMYKVMITTDYEISGETLNLLLEEELHDWLIYLMDNRYADFEKNTIDYINGASRNMLETFEDAIETGSLSDDDELAIRLMDMFKNNGIELEF